MMTLKKWSIEFHYDARNDNGKVIRVASTFQTEANSIPEAYLEADKLSDTLNNVSIGAIMPGWHDFSSICSKVLVK